MIADVAIRGDALIFVSHDVVANKSP